MNKTALKIFLCFTLTAAVIATILLGMNFLGIAFICSDDNNLYQNSPHKLLDDVSGAFLQTENGFAFTEEPTIPDDCWCILIDETGRVIWQKNKPSDIPEQYSLNDIARMTRWFLNDYPVYVHTEDFGLLVLGYPKNAVGKYSIEYSMKWFDTLPIKIIGVLVLNLCLAALLACLFGANLYRRIRILMHGIDDLRQEKNVQLKERGIFKEISQNINNTAAAIERKNNALAQRDNARSNWISGISHDIRTPLAVIMGYSETLAESGALSAEHQKKAQAIAAQSIKIKKLIEDLNLISSLEYDMQPFQKSHVRLCPFLRRVVTDMLNSGLSKQFAITLDLQDEKAVIFADEGLLERAIFNLLSNSIVHNEHGCAIHISEYSDAGTFYLCLSDNGSGVPDEVIKNITKLPKSSHGLGLPMAYKIIHVHGGQFTAVNNNGFTVKIALPKLTAL